MKGHYKKRGCTCGTDNCKCGKTWSFVVDIGLNPKTGRRKQVTKAGFKTKEEAELAVANLLNEIRQGTFFEESNILFRDYADIWLQKYIERVKPKPGTIRVRKYSITKLLTYFNHLKLRSITDEMYQSLLNDFKEQGLAKSTLDGIHVTGRMIFKMAISKRILRIDPTELAYVPKDDQVCIGPEEDDDGEEELNENELPKYFEKEELLNFLDAVKENGLFMDELTFAILAYTGMRVGELVVLKWKDIDFQNNTISITKTYSNEKNNTKNYVLVRPKTIKSKRKILVDDYIIELLKKHKLEQEILKSKFGEKYRDRGYIITNLNRHPGYPVLPKQVRSRMDRIIRFLEFEQKKFTPHSFRHTHTSLLTEAGVGIEEIMERLGHSTEKTTRKIYLHVTEKMKTKAADKFGEFMRSKVMKKLD